MMCDAKDALILVIDDNLDNLFLMELILTNDGYKVEKACCGQEGVSKTHDLIPDLIVLDMMMPDMTGLDVINSIKAHDCLSQIPIVLCTANQYITRNDVIEVDAICYKPFDITDMLIIINSLIACYEDTSGTTIVLEVDDRDPLHAEQQQLTSSLDNEHQMLDALQNEGYEIICNQNTAKLVA